MYRVLVVVELAWLAGRQLTILYTRYDISYYRSGRIYLVLVAVEVACLAGRRLISDGRGDPSTCLCNSQPAHTISLL